MGAAGAMTASVIAWVSRLAPTRVREGPGSLLPALPIRWQARHPVRSRTFAPGRWRLGIDASAKMLLVVDPLLVEANPALVDEGFEPQPARVVASAIVTIQLAVHRGFRTTETLRDVPASRPCWRRRRRRSRRAPSGAAAREAPMQAICNNVRTGRAVVATRRKRPMLEER